MATNELEAYTGGVYSQHKYLNLVSFVLCCS